MYLSRLLAIIISGILITLTGCCGCGNNVEPAKCLTINESILTPYNNADSTPVVAADNDVPGVALMLELGIKNSIEICFQKTDRNIFFNTATATSCRKADKIVMDSIVYISIFADKDYDRSHPAGTELNECFLMPATQNINEKEQLITARFYATKAPEKPGVYIYTVRLYMQNGDTTDVKSAPVNIVL